MGKSYTDLGVFKRGVTAFLDVQSEGWGQRKEERKKENKLLPQIHSDV